MESARARIFDASDIAELGSMARNVSKIKIDHTGRQWEKKVVRAESSEDETRRQPETLISGHLVKRLGGG